MNRTSISSLSLQTKKGYTLTEMMVTVAIMGLIFLVLPQFFIFATRFERLNSAQIEVQRDARNLIAHMNRDIRQAISTSVVIDNISGQPPYSRITFQKIQGDNISYYQEGRDLKEIRNGNTITLSDKIGYLGFVFPRSDSLTLVSVSITLSKSTYQGKQKALQMSVEKVKIMN